VLALALTICTKKQHHLAFSLIGQILRSSSLVITFCVRRSRGKMYIGDVHLCVCVCPSTHAHTTAWTWMWLWGMVGGCSVVVHYWADLQSVDGFCCCDNSPNTKCQRVLVLALCLVMAALCSRSARTLYFCSVVSSIFFLPRLISAVAEWMYTKLPHMVWP